MRRKRLNYRKIFFFPKLVAKDYYKGYEFQIWNHYGIPTVYIKLSIEVSKYEFLQKIIDGKFVVQGGISAVDSIWDEPGSCYWIGLKYKTLKFIPSILGYKEEKWTTRKVFKEVKSFIKQLIQIDLDFNHVRKVKWMHG
ncbi:MAG TPA: hypothetical protein PKV66_05155 [Candidatus Pelethenecus sp.]|nr:hypothetical protein [Candidatus Pelethenecus sp.]